MSAKELARGERWDGELGSKGEKNWDRLQKKAPRKDTPVYTDCQRKVKKVKPAKGKTGIVGVKEEIR